MSAPATRGSRAISVAGGAIAIEVFQLWALIGSMYWKQRREKWEPNGSLPRVHVKSLYFHGGWGPAIAGLGNTYSGFKVGEPFQHLVPHQKLFSSFSPTGARTLSLDSYRCSAAATDELDFVHDIFSHILNASISSSPHLPISHAALMRRRLLFFPLQASIFRSLDRPLSSQHRHASSCEVPNADTTALMHRDQHHHFV